MTRAPSLRLPLAALGLAAALAASPAQAQSPWTLNRSGFFFQSTFQYLSSDEFYDALGEKQSRGDGASFRDATQNLYLEYGIRDHLGLVMNLPVKSLQLEQAGTQPELTNTGFGDLTLGLKYQAIQRPVVVSIQGDATIPTGYDVLVTEPPLGDGQADYTARLLVGRSLFPRPGFVQAALGYRAREQAPADELLFTASGGYWVHPRVLVVGNWEFVEHQGDGEIEDFFKGGLQAIVRVSEAVDLVGGVNRVFGGQNTTAGNQLVIGVAFKGNQLGKYEGRLASTMEEQTLPLEFGAPSPFLPAPPDIATEEDSSS